MLISLSEKKIFGFRYTLKHESLFERYCSFRGSSFQIPRKEREKERWKAKRRVIGKKGVKHIFPRWICTSLRRFMIQLWKETCLNQSKANARMRSSITSRKRARHGGLRNLTENYTNPPVLLVQIFLGQALGLFWCWSHLFLASSDMETVQYHPPCW